MNVNEIKERMDKIVKDWDMYYRKDIEINGVKGYIYNYSYFDNREYAKIDDKICREMRGCLIIEGNFFPSIHKFFNLEEEHCDIKGIEVCLDKNTPGIEKENCIKKVFDKFDGVLCMPVLINNEVIFKTKTSFSNLEAKTANKLVTEKQKEILRKYLENGHYPMFELVGRNSKIVINYGEPELKLIAIRYFEDEKIKYVSDIEIKRLAKELSIDYADFEYVHLGNLIERFKIERGIEGVVIRVGDDFAKLKTHWYLKLHSVTKESLTEKKLFDIVLNNEDDDILSNIKIYFPEIYDVVNSYVNRIKDYLEEKNRYIKEVFTKLDTMDRREYVMKFGKKDAGYFKYHNREDNYNATLECVKKEFNTSNKIIEKFGKIFN